MNRIVIAALVLAAPLRVIAQSAVGPEFNEGARVKIRTATVHAAVGSVAQASADSVILYTDGNGSRLAVSRSEITQTYLSLGKTSAAGAKKGAVWGAAFGLVGGAMMSAPCKRSNGEKCDQGAYAHTTGGQRFATVFISETLFGTALGALIKAEEWRESSSQPRVSVKPNGAGIALAINFR